MYPHCLFISTADTYFIDFQLLADTNSLKWGRTQNVCLRIVYADMKKALARNS